MRLAQYSNERDAAWDGQDDLLRCRLPDDIRKTARSSDRLAVKLLLPETVTLEAFPFGHIYQRFEAQ
jgi:hypothetical protein